MNFITSTTGEGVTQPENDAQMNGNYHFKATIPAIFNW